jgi:hypothetical protein
MGHETGKSLTQVNARIKIIIIIILKHDLRVNPGPSLVTGQGDH